MKGALSSLGGGSSGRSRKPSKKGMLGIVAITGLGAAAMAKRRRDGSEDGAPSYPPVQSGEARTGESTAEARTEESTAEARTEESTTEARTEESSRPAA